MNKWRRRLALPLWPMLFFLLSGCAGESGVSYDYCTVMIESGANYAAFGGIQTVKRGGDVNFTVQLANNNLIASVDYPGYTVAAADVPVVDGASYQVLTLHNIRYPTVVSLKTYQPYVIFYHANGAERQDGGNAEEWVAASAGVSHLRPNTALGTDLFTRNGYVQTGWNTAADGSGLHIGLGSRVDRGEAIRLYAEWSQWTDEAAFDYEIVAGMARIVGYRGTHAALTIPAQLGGYPLREIGAGACAGAVCETLVFPPGLETVGSGAFADSEVRKIYLYDSIHSISDDSFRGCSELETLHINANRAPSYSGTYFDTFPDKMDWLRGMRKKEKIVLFAGSSTRFGYDSPRLDEAFPAYEIANMGVYAYCNARPQYDLLLDYMEPGDILLSTPEFDTISTQFCCSTDIDKEFFCMVESDYDLFARLDCRSYTNIFDALCEFLAIRRTLPEKSYSISPKNYDENGAPVSGMETYNQYGDYIYPRPNQKSDSPIGIRLADYRVAAFSQETVECLNNVYRAFTRKNVFVYFAYAPRSLRAITEESTAPMRAQLHDHLAALLCVPIISPVEESMFTGHYFYETDNHLSDEGVQIQTERIISNLKQQMARDGVEG